LSRKMGIVLGEEYLATYGYQSSNRGFPAGIVFDDLNAFVDVVIGWQDVVARAANNPILWDIGIASLMSAAAADGDLGDLEQFKYSAQFIMKVYGSRTGTIEDWIVIVNRATSQPEKWIKGINSIDAAAEAEGDLGDTEVFKYFRELIVKINALPV